MVTARERDVQSGRVGVHWHLKLRFSRVRYGLYEICVGTVIE